MKRAITIPTVLLVAMALTAVLVACGGGGPSPTPLPPTERPTRTPYLPPPTATPIAGTGEETGEEPGDNGSGQTPDETPGATGAPAEEGTVTPGGSGGDEEPTESARIPTAIPERAPTATPVPTETPPGFQVTPEYTPMPPGSEETQENAKILTECLNRDPGLKQQARVEVRAHLDRRIEGGLDKEAEKERELEENDTELRKEEVRSGWVLNYLLVHVPYWKDENDTSTNSWIAWCLRASEGQG